ncbi:hypothetical protein ACFL6G_05840 [candidate division KSB1 bacterium]
MIGRKKLKTLLLLTLALLLLTVNTPIAQEHKNFLLKKVGNLYILNIGANDNIKLNGVYNLYFEKVKRIPLIKIKLKTKREFFGAVQVTQVFPSYSVVRVLSRAMLEEPSGNKIILIYKPLDKKKDETGGKTVPDLPMSPLKDTGPAEITKELELPYRDASYRPFSIGIDYFRQLDEIAKPITESVYRDMKEFIYNGVGADTVSYPSSGGFKFNISKMITPYLAVEAGLGFITQKSSMLTGRGPDNEPVPGVISVRQWNINFENKIKLLNITLHASRYNKALPYFTGEEAGRRHSPRFGLGVNYAKIDVSMSQKALLDKAFQDEEIFKSEKADIGGYWGWHTTFGYDYYIQGFRVFAEMSYYNWFTDKFKSDLPLSFGISIMF